MDKVSEALGVELREDIEEIWSCDGRDELLAHLERFAQQTFKGIMLAAAVVARFQSLGFQFTDEDAAKVPTLQLFRLLADGQLSPELVRRFLWGNTTLYDMASRLPVADQEQIAADATFKLYERGGDYREMCLSVMGKVELRQMIDRRKRCLRNSAEQLAYLREEDAKRQLREAAKRTEAVVDPKARQVMIGQNSYSLDEVLGWVKDMTRARR